MNSLIAPNELTMSSREISELTGKRHDNVLVDIRKMLAEIGSPEKTGQYKDSTGRSLPVLFLNRDEADCLVTGYSAKMRMVVIKRWRELEESNAINLNDPNFLRGVLLSYTEKNIELQKEVEQKSAKIQSLESMFIEGMTVAQFCKQLNGVNTQAVNKYLAQRNWLYSDGRGWRVKSNVRDKYLTEKASHTFINSLGIEVIKYKQELLKSGASRLHKMYMNGELPMKSDWDQSYDHSKFLFTKEIAK